MLRPSLRSGCHRWFYKALSYTCLSELRSNCTSRVEEAVSHWSGKYNTYMYVAWPTVSVWKAAARGLTMFRGLVAHVPYYVKHNQHVKHVKAKRSGGIPQKTFEK